MMARAIWTGSLSIGLVTVPVGMYSATEDHRTSFHQIQRGTSDRIRLRRVNERTGREVEFSDIVKGYDLGDDQYVIIEPKELEEIAPGRSRAIQVSAFVDLADVDPIFFAATYYLAPRGKEYGQIYSLLLEALEDSQKVAVATMVMRGKEHLTAIRAADNVLQLHTLYYADEVRTPAEELPSLPERVKVDHEQLAAARRLIDALSIDWNPEEYRDSFEDRVHELIDAKRAGQEIVTADEAPQATNVIDLMEALRRSLDRAGDNPARSTASGSAADRKAAKRAPVTAHKAGRPSRPQDVATKAELYARASELNVPGRSSMTREQLERALAKAETHRHSAA